jgi:deazaflavin-dependent oxidoreductase (nitroreductase family)
MNTLALSGDLIAKLGRSDDFRADGLSPGGIMSDSDDFNRRNIEEFRANHGRVGGQFEGAPVLLLHSVGARSGEERVSPMMYLADGERYLVFASAAGADRNPAWYWNLNANPDASIEVGDEHLDVHAVELTGTERDKKYAEQARRYPGFADYERKTTRTIPVLALLPRGPHIG